MHTCTDDPFIRIEQQQKKNERKNKHMRTQRIFNVPTWRDDCDLQ